MKQFVHSSGVILSFGFDMTTRLPDNQVICWSDPSGAWEPEENNWAGATRLPFPIDPVFVVENNGLVTAAQDGLVIHMGFSPDNMAWVVNISKSFAMQSQAMH